jgi:YspA, cpYpsA-related SLOG family
MKLIIAGSRGITDIRHVEEAMESAIATAGWVVDVIEIVSGTAPGVDRLGEQYAQAAGIPVKRIPAQWDVHGRRAGHIRNALMAEYADAAVLVWDGSSPGTCNMASQMKKRDKPCFIWTVLP